MSTFSGCLPQLDSRSEYVDYLEEAAGGTGNEPSGPDAKRTRIKTYMLETARDGGHRVPEIHDLFSDPIHLHRLDDALWRVEHRGSNGGEVVGLIEQLNDRHPVFYARLPAEDSDKWVRKNIDPNPWLDRLWLSSTILFELWRYVQDSTPTHRYVRLGFEHEASYEAVSNAGVFDDHDEMLSAEDRGTAIKWKERRRSIVTLTEQLGLLNTKLQPLIEQYDPLHSLVQLQIPVADYGGHRFYYDGRATNWSDSFVEHRATVGMVVHFYRTATEIAENRLWMNAIPAREDGFTLQGAPVTIRFGNQLSRETFDRFVDLAIKGRTSRFRIGGYITRRRTNQGTCSSNRPPSMATVSS